MKDIDGIEKQLSEVNDYHSNLLEQNPEERYKKLDQIEEALQNISLNI